MQLGEHVYLQPVRRVHEEAERQTLKVGSRRLQISQLLPMDMQLTVCEFRVPFSRISYFALMYPVKLYR